MIYNFQQGDKTYAVNLETRADGTYLAVIDGRSYQIEASMMADGVWSIRLDGSSVSKTVYTAAEGRERYIKVKGESVNLLTLPDTRSGRRRVSGAAGDSRLVAQMPGQVVEVYVMAGENVAVGQTLVVLEAMKMEIRVAAPREGVVKQVSVKKGDIVEREQVLIEIE